MPDAPAPEDREHPPSCVICGDPVDEGDPVDPEGEEGLCARCTYRALQPKGYRR